MFAHPDVGAPTAALESLVESRYGFSVFDLGVDLSDFEQIHIAAPLDYNQFGEFSKIEGEVIDYLSRVGPNDLNVVKRAAAKIDRIVKMVMSSSGKQTAWICLRASTATDRYDLPRWHMDGHYYRQSDSLQYKFATTLIGASTHFYPLSRELKELRRVIRIHTGNRKFTSELCQGGPIFSPTVGEGVFVLAGDRNVAALHTEPPIHEPRLFFSIVPCSEEELKDLKTVVIDVYQKRE